MCALEFRAVQAVVVRCLAEQSAFRHLPVPEGVCRFEVALGEAILIGSAGSQGRVVDAACKYLRDRDPHALIFDETAGSSVWALSGSACDEAFARLSAIPIPKTRPATAQGAIASIPGKAMFFNDYIVIMVPTTLAHHLRARVLVACADLGVYEPAADSPRFAPCPPAGVLR